MSCPHHIQAEPMSPDNDLFDTTLLIQRRSRIAAAICDHDFLLKRATEDIIARLGAVLRDFPVVLNIGAHHGLLGHALRELPSVGRVINTDSCFAMVERSDPPWLVCDEEQLPFAPQSADLIVSGLALQLVNDLPGALIQIRRILKPDCLFVAAVLGGETLVELRQAFMEAEAELEGGASPRVAPTADVRDYGSLLQRAGFAMPVSDSDLLQVSYASPIALMRELRAMGTTNVLRARARRPLRRATLDRAVEIYQERFATDNRRVTASFEIIYLTGWAPDPSQPKPLRPGSAKTRLADALGVEERSAGEPTGAPTKK
jgi:NADH dehydrogenase [ubiquinone] 1 alpha subcomplex assembly factor 5